MLCLSIFRPFLVLSVLSSCFLSVILSLSLSICLSVWLCLFPSLPKDDTISIPRFLATFLRNLQKIKTCNLHFASQKRSDSLRELDPRAGSRWQISSLIVNFPLLFPGKINSRIGHQNSTLLAIKVPNSITQTRERQGGGEGGGGRTSRGDTPTKNSFRKPLTSAGFALPQAISLIHSLVPRISLR